MIVTPSSPIRLNRERYAYLGRALVNTGCKADPDDARGKGSLWGIRECGAHSLEFDHYPFNEFIYLLQGDVELATSNGRIERFSRSDCFIIPRGLQCIWTSTDSVRKLYVVCDDETRQNRFRLERAINACYQELVDHSGPVKKIC